MPYFENKMMQYIEDTIVIMRKKIYVPVSILESEAWVTHEPAQYNLRTQGSYKKLEVGDKWGDLWDCAWFHFQGLIPASEAGNHVVALLDVSGEGCIVDEYGNPVQGITCVEDDYDRKTGMTGKRVYRLSKSATGGEKVDFWMDAGCNDLFGNYHGRGLLKQAEISRCNDGLRSLFYDFQTLFDLMKTLQERSARRKRLLFTLYEAAHILKDYSSDEISAAGNAIRAELMKVGGDPSLTFSAIGHAHIDLAWLWPIRETIRKGARTFSTVLVMMEEYPEYKFGASQPQLYQWMKEYYPDLYRRIKEKIKEGRWEVQGAMWVEADTNLIGGESLVRQILYGKRFYKEEFGIEVDSLWLPDVFGYSAALPQILKRSGNKYFMTQKLSWNEHNKFPHQSFWWEGIDGSRILAHMLPEETYNGPMAPSSIKYAELNYIDSGLCENALMLFGIGDGGGGPGREHLERASRMKNLDGVSPVIQEFSSDFFKKLQKTSEKLKTWRGELYLEKHQGTLTSQAKNKQYNRNMELLLGNLELALVLSDGINTEMKEVLDRLWQEVLLYQFHDIIPGSSIKRVYDESQERYQLLEQQAKELCDYYFGIAASNMGGETVINPLCWRREEWIHLENGCYAYVKVPSMGYSLASAEMPQEPISVKCGDDYISNEYLKVVFEKDGTIKSVYDRINCQEVMSGSGNALEIYREEHHSDAWDIDIAYLDEVPDYFELVEQKARIDGPEAIFEQSYRYGKSNMELKVSLVSGREYVEFDMQIDWQEDLKMLRTSFPVNVYAQQAAYEIQFGKIYRPVHQNTSWDLARFEVSGHKWMDLSQNDYGVALLSVGKYGFSCIGNIMSMNLLRSQNYPCVQGDRGKHRIRYALYPHTGNEIAGKVTKKAYEFNVPLFTVNMVEATAEKTATGAAVKTGEWNKEYSLLSVSGDLIAHTVKPSEDKQAVVVRLYEPNGQSSTTTVKFNENYTRAYLCDLLENKESEICIQAGKIVLNAGPFELITLKLEK